MDPVYLDLHIHTSDDPSSLNENYDLDTLISKVKETAQGDNYLISLTDHNTINEVVYLKAVEKLGSKIILGVELHIKAYAVETASSYHCHIYFELEEINSIIIKDLNSRLDILYPNKKPEKTDVSIPTIERVLDAFDSYSFLLLPHGGQSHATLDEAMPEGKVFDTLMEKSIYYNFLDGFTSRSNVGTEKTIAYLERLGVNEFVNLITCTDNYNPLIYPNSKAEGAAEFIPTWMNATANFNGLRLSLTDSARFEYNKTKPRVWRESIRSVKLLNENVDIDAQFTPGLNVIIGESSSGKTMLVDSLRRVLSNQDFNDSRYNQKYDVQSLVVDFPDATVPHFISQNFISDVISDDRNVNEIEIIKQIFPNNVEAVKTINRGLEDLKKDLEALFDSVESLENIESELKAIPVLSKLISTKKISDNILKSFLLSVSELKRFDYGEEDKNRDLEVLREIGLTLKANPFIEHDESLVSNLEQEIDQMRQYSYLEQKVREAIRDSKLEVDEDLKTKHGEEQNRKQKFETLLEGFADYHIHLNKFSSIVEKITSYSIKSESNHVEIQGHVLSVKNEFALTEDILKKELNKLLLDACQVTDIKTLSPNDLFRSNFKNNLSGSQRNSGPTYKYIKENIYSEFSKSNKVSYQIKTSAGRDFTTLSPGLKTAVILDLVINFEEDDAPLIIDQPEDNLATSYINGDLVKSIKNNKKKKQIIFVSHNATIPMSGDAQNLILCENNGGKITIKSSPLEGKIGDKSAVDYIAKITDGGKSSVKKRFKKYNLKQFKD